MHDASPLFIKSPFYVADLFLSFASETFDFSLGFKVGIVDCLPDDFFDLSFCLMHLALTLWLLEMHDSQRLSSSNQPENAEYDQVDRDDVVQQSRKNENQDSRDERSQRFRRNIDLHISLSPMEFVCSMSMLCRVSSPFQIRPVNKRITKISIIKPTTPLG